MNHQKKKKSSQGSKHSSLCATDEPRSRLKRITTEQNEELLNTDTLNPWKLEIFHFSPPERKRWTLAPLFGFWLISFQRTPTEPEPEPSRSRPTAPPGNSDVSPA